MSIVALESSSSVLLLNAEGTFIHLNQKPIDMISYKITWYKGFYLDPYMTGDNIIKANTEDEAIDIFNREYLSKGRHWDSVVNCSSLEYQLAYDNEQFDSNGRRRF